MDMKNILQHIVDLRNPSRITLGLRPIAGDGTLTMRDGRDHTPPALPPIATGAPPSRSPGRTRNSKGELKKYMYMYMYSSSQKCLLRVTVVHESTMCTQG